MTVLRYLQLDVFAAAPGRGNPLGVIADANQLTEAQMQRLAAWLNLAETIFFLTPDAPAADYHIRIFTPSCELPFAGHPSVGAAWAAVELGLARPRNGALVQQCAAGLLPVRIEEANDGRRIQLRCPRGQRIDADANGIPADLAALAQPQSAAELWHNGAYWWLLEASSAKRLRALRPDFSAISAWSVASAASGVAIYAREASSDHSLAVRVFCPADAPSVPEDPVTGSANALIAARLRQQARLPGDQRHYVASQGRELGRDGRIEISVDDDGDIWIGGQVQAVIDGHLAW